MNAVACRRVTAGALGPEAESLPLVHGADGLWPAGLPDGSFVVGRPARTPDRAERLQRDSPRTLGAGNVPRAGALTHGNDKSTARAKAGNDEGKRPEYDDYNRYDVCLSLDCVRTPGVTADNAGHEADERRMERNPRGG
jgi:hypothetical protein